MARWIRFGIPLVSGAVISLVSFACGSDEDGDGGGGTGGTDGDASVTGGMGGGGTGGGTGGRGGGTGGGGSGGGGAGGMPVVDAGDPYECYARQMDPANDVNPSGTDMADTDCCSALGTCTAPADLSADPNAERYGHSNCTETLVCAPKPASELPDGGMLPSCHADYGAQSLEGRCLPKCFTLGDPAAANITVGDCPAMAFGVEIVCAPCFNPIDGTATGACTRDGDMPVDPAPTPFAECGDFGAADAAAGPAMGLCVPEALVAASGSDITLIPADTCGTGDLCAPKNKVEDTSSCFAKCTSAFGVGACVADYLIENSMPGAVALLGAVPPECVEGEHCAPCISPVTMMASGACAN